jgi:hypothetical protein
MSSLKDLASLIMVPSLYKDGELHTVKPLADEDVILHPDATGNHDGNDGSTARSSSNFTFSRGSNLAATRVDVNGLIEKGRENEALQSNSFNTSPWSLEGSATLTSGQSGYDGSSNAWLLSKTSDWSRVEQTISHSGVYTFSLYAKAGTIDWMAIENSGIAADTTYFNLSNGTKGSVGSGTIGSSIESVGNGWYRCSVTINGTSAIQRIYVATSNGNINGSNGNIYIQDAQLEQGLVATDYIETGATTAQAGILEDMPRLDYSGGASCPSLLLEPQRSNLATSSEYFEQVFTETSGVSWEHNSTTSPEGLNNASKLSNTSNNNGAYYVSMSFTDNDTMTASIFAKQGSRDVLQFGVSNQNESKSYYYRFNLSEGTASYYANNGGMLNGTGSIEDYGNGWYRCIVTATFPSSGTTSGGVFPRVVGTGNLYLYGLQVEKNVSYPTSYIPTYGSSVTRSADGAGVQDASLSNVIGQTAGVIFADLDLVDHSSTADHRFSISSGSSQNWIFMSLENGDRLRYYIRTANTQRVDSTITSVISKGNTYKIAFRYESGNNAIFINGVKVQSNSTTWAAPDSNLIRLNISGTSGDTNISQADILTRINQTLTFPTALTDSECIALTTL